MHPKNSTYSPPGHLGFSGFGRLAAVRLAMPEMCGREFSVLPSQSEDPWTEL